MLENGLYERGKLVERFGCDEYAQMNKWTNMAWYMGDDGWMYSVPVGRVQWVILAFMLRPGLSGEYTMRAYFNEMLHNHIEDFDRETGERIVDEPSNSFVFMKSGAPGLYMAEGKVKVIPTAGKKDGCAAYYLKGIGPLEFTTIEPGEGSMIIESDQFWLEVALGEREQFGGKIVKTGVQKRALQPEG